MQESEGTGERGDKTEQEIFRPQQRDAWKEGRGGDNRRKGD